MKITKELIKKIIVFAIPKIIILILAFIGIMHLWDSINFCEINFIDDVTIINASWNRTVFLNYNEMSYFFNRTNTGYLIPSNTYMNCTLMINPSRKKVY